MWEKVSRENKFLKQLVAWYEQDLDFACNGLLTEKETAGGYIYKQELEQTENIDFSVEKKFRTIIHARNPSVIISFSLAGTTVPPSP